jgi:ribosome-associated protein
MIRITSTITIDDSELRFDFVRSSGPGGQNVNKVSTAVQLRFDAARSPSLAADVRERLARLAGRRMTADGILVITARRHRSQQDNREDAIARLVSLLKQAAVAPKTRRKTKPTKQSRERRLEDKRRAGQIKKKRRRVRDEDE